MTTAEDEHHPLLPEWQVGTWLNTPHPLTLQSLRGRVVLLHAFQMLCPGCVAYGLPQAQRVRQTFPATELAVIGLHTVFEHHAVMTVDALRAFVHEYRWRFPIGVDEPDGRGGASLTMARYGLRGTPSCLVLNQHGRVHLHHVGQIDDLVLGALLGRLIAGSALPSDANHAPKAEAAVCMPDGCRA
ncbi:MAG: peroxiredoxin family protein [Lautropia sp.]